tara:strand:- start:300 stop:428 length:129 start_codon:yes stop_codon:yes gene_type:complete
VIGLNGIERSASWYYATLVQTISQAMKDAGVTDAGALVSAMV